jgi:hypothetical protein
MATVARTAHNVTHYAYLGDLYGTAELLNGSGYLFREDGQRHATLVSKRTTGGEKAYDDDLSNAPASTPRRTFVWLSSVRGAMDQGFEEAQTELGMAHYAVRK